MTLGSHIVDFIDEGASRNASEYISLCFCLVRVSKEFLTVHVGHTTRGRTAPAPCLHRTRCRRQKIELLDTTCCQKR